MIVDLTYIAATTSESLDTWGVMVNRTALTSLVFFFFLFLETSCTLFLEMRSMLDSKVVSNDE